MRHVPRSGMAVVAQRDVPLYLTIQIHLFFFYVKFYTQYEMVRKKFLLHVT